MRPRGRPQLDALRDGIACIAWTCRATALAPTSEFTLDGAAERGGGHRSASARRPRDPRRPVARRLRRDDPRRARDPIASGGWSSPARRPSRSGSAVPFRRSSWAWSGSTARALDAAQRLVLPAALPAGDRRADHRGRVLVAGRRAGVRAARRRAVPAPAGRIRGPDLIVNGECDLLFRLGAGAFARAAHDARRVRSARARRTCRTSTGRRPSPRPSGGSPDRSADAPR